MWKSGNVEMWKSGNLEIKDAYYCPYPTQLWMCILLLLYLYIRIEQGCLLLPQSNSIVDEHLLLLYEQEHKSVSDYPQGR